MLDCVYRRIPQLAYRHVTATCGTYSAVVEYASRLFGVEVSADKLAYFKQGSAVLL